MVAPRLTLFLACLLLLVMYPGLSFAQDESGVSNGKVCIQVATSAINPETGKCEGFATPCDVPEGWVVGCNSSGESRPENKIYYCMLYSPARNQQTGECKDFGCTKIPEGWVKVDRCASNEGASPLPASLPDGVDSRPIIDLPIKIEIPKLMLPFPKGRGVKEGKAELALPVSPSLQAVPSLRLKAAPEVAVSEEMQASAEKVLRTAIREKIIDLPKESLVPNQEKETIFDVELLEDAGEKAYKIKGFKQKRIFGLIPVAIQKEVFVSAKSGEVINEEVSFFDRLLEKISF